LRWNNAHGRKRPIAASVSIPVAPEVLPRLSKPYPFDALEAAGGEGHPHRGYRFALVVELPIAAQGAIHGAIVAAKSKINKHGTSV